MSERSEVLALLDELHAAECAGAAAMRRWLEISADPMLRGGLRVIVARDRAHAALALDRLQALGGAPTARPGGALASLLRLIEAADVSDDVKLRAVIGRLPADHRDPILEAAARIVEDRETRALVETMGDDDHASLSWLRAMSEQRERPPDAAGDPDATRAGLAVLAGAEAASAAVFDAWRDACEQEGLRGGLRTIAARERTQAELLTARLEEIGGDPPVHLAAAAQVAARWASSEWSDAAKLDALLAHQPSPDAAAARVVALAHPADPETRAILRLVAGGEHATVSWLRAYRGAGARRTEHWDAGRQHA